jgi:DnaJ-class molecular chaperone
MDVLLSCRPDYDLVRCYHPDAAAARDVPPPVAHARFQAIRAAYDTLNGCGGPRNAHSDVFEAEFAFRRRAHDSRVRYRRKYGVPDFDHARFHEEEEARHDRILAMFGSAVRRRFSLDACSRAC